LKIKKLFLQKFIGPQKSSIKILNADWIPACLRRQASAGTMFKVNYYKFGLILFLFLAAGLVSSYSQDFKLKPSGIFLKKQSALNQFLPDSTKKNVTGKKFKAGAIFISFGTGLNVPVKEFNSNSKATFGILGRIELSNTSIFPFVIGGEITYWSYKADDQFLTLNLLNTFRTKIVSLGLSIEYSFARIFNSPYSIPFLTLDVKTNRIKRDIDAGRTLAGLPATDSKISVGAGIGVTLFVFDFYLKYNFMKELSNFGAYAKIKFPVIRF
jgi:hypothetical protein